MKLKKKNYIKNNLYNKKNIFKKRIKIILITLLILLIIIIYKIYKLQVIKYKKYSNLSKQNYSKIINIIPYRGLIFDRKGIPLVKNKKYYCLVIIPNKINNINKIINFLKKINIPKKKIDDLKFKITNKKNNLNTYVISKEINKKQINNYLFYKKYLRGIYIIKYFRRYYLYNKSITHIIGYANKNKVNKNITGKTGIEKYYNNILFGKNGYKKIIINNKGKILNVSNIIFSKPGKNIKLTINIKLQNFIYNLLKNNKSSVIISNPKNGEILSLISTPSYDTNLFTKKISYKEYNKIIKNKNKILINKAIQEIYPPASTIKPYIVLAALKEKNIKINYIMFDPGWWKLPKSNKIFYDWKKWGHGLINIKKSIEESSDTFYYQIAYNMGIKKLIKWIKIFGYGKKTGIDLPNENKGIIPNKKIIKKKNWYIGDTISIGIGQGHLAITPIQIHNSLITLINNGKKIKLHLLMKINNKNKIQYNKKKIINIKKKYWNLIKKSMYGVAYNKNGTAYKDFLNTKYKLAVKSGTAQVYSIKKYQRYNNKKKINKNLKDHTLMNAFIPYKNPKFAITIIFEHGGNGFKIGYIMRKITDFISKNKNSIY